MPPDGYRVGVLGATGAVGSTMLEVLGERGFPAAEVVAFASERSAGRKLAMDGRELECRPLSGETIQGLDLVLSSAGGEVSAEWAPKLVEAGAVVVDNTSYWRMHEEVPLVVAEVNPEALDAHRGIVANPNCSAMQMVVALAPIHRAVGDRADRRLHLPARVGDGPAGDAGAPRPGARGAPRRRAAGRRGVPAPDRVQRASPGGDVQGWRRLHDRGAQDDGRDAQDPRRRRGELRISATCVRVPVLHGESESINVQTREPLSPEECRELLAGAPGVMVVDAPAEGVYPLASDAAGPGRGAGGPHPPRSLARALPQPLGRRRQPPQGGGHERRAGRRAAPRARPDPPHRGAGARVGGHPPLYDPRPWSGRMHPSRS